MSEQETSPSPKQQTLTIQQALDLGVEHHNAGRLPEAENIYNQILQTDPNQPDALHFLGVIAYQMGKSDIAVDLIGKALAIKPDFAEAHLNLGFALREQGKLGDAVVSYHKAIEIMPDYAEVLNNPSTGIHKLKLSPLDPPFSKPAPLEYEELYRPGMGTENVGPLLRSLVQMVRPQRILEIGAGYTTPFLLEAVVNNERVFNDGNLNQSYFNNYEYDSKLVVIDDMSLGELAKNRG